jgi:hypothetical protein
MLLISHNDGKVACHGAILAPDITPENSKQIDKCHGDPDPFLLGYLPLGIGCPEATLPTSEVLISLVIRKILVGV